MARADIHIFGSVSGYSTIAATAGVRADETRELEQFQFGEISTSDAMSRLETQATMTSRMLASGRMAISRMLPAGVDDAGRPTIEVITLIVDARVYDAQLGVLALLADDAALWRDARGRVRTGIDYPTGVAPASDPRDPALVRILDAWMHATRTGSVAILPASAQLDLLRFVSTLDASDRRRCRWGIGINSLSSPVDVCTMMPGASTHGARAGVRPAPAGQWHCAETEFAQFRASGGGATWIPTSQMIVGATVGAVGVGDASNSFTPDATTRGGFNEQQKRALVISMIAATCATLLFAIAAGVYLNKSSGNKSSAVLAGGGESGSSGGGAEGGVLPPLDESSRKVVWDEPKPAPSASETGAASTRETAAATPGTLAASEPVKVTLVTYYLDKDGDTFGDESTRVSLDPGEKRPAHVMQGGDLNDGDKSVYPGAPETCADIGVDNNCNGDTDDVDGGETVVDWYLDEDDDGFGDPKTASVKACASKPPKHYVRDNTDECPKNKLRRSDLVCGCDWAGPDADSDENGICDCKDPGFDKARRLVNELRSAKSKFTKLTEGLESVVHSFEKLRDERNRLDFRDRQNQLGQQLLQQLLQADEALKDVYRARLLGDFGRVVFKARDLTKKEARDVHCIWLEVLSGITRVRELIHRAERTQALPPLPSVDELLSRRLNPADSDVGWNMDEFPHRKLCEWVLGLLYTDGALLDEQDVARRRCEG